MDRLLQLLEDSKLDLSELEVADVLWLACHLDRPPEAEPVPEDLEAPTPGDGSEAGPAAAGPKLATVPGTGPGTDPTAGGAGAPTERTAQPEPPGRAGDDEPGADGVTVRLPRAPALPGAVAIQRALRPFKRRVASLTESVLDEEATAERFAETGVLAPVPQPARERWLEVALVVDEHESMAVWRDTVEELAGVLVRLGGFRDVRLWGLGSDESGVWLARGVRIGRTASSERRAPHELVDATGRRLVLVVSDCVGPGWRSGAIVSRALERWARSGPLAIIQVLPRRQWERTGLGASRSVDLSARGPGCPNSSLRAVDRTISLLPPGPAAGDGSRILVPVLTLEEGSVGAWASLVSGQGRAPGRDFAAAGGPVPAAPLPGDAEADERVRRFRRDATPTAKRLAGFLAAAPLQLPIMRLVQRAMLPESRQSHLAEVLLSGLVRRVSPAGAAPDEIEYDFHQPEIRELLLGYSLRHETVRVVEEVSAWLERNRGVRTGFRAALGGQAERLDSGDQPYARLTADVLRRLGGEFGEVAQRIDATRRGDAAGEDASARPGREAAAAGAESAAASETSPGEAAGELEWLAARTRDFSLLIDGLTAELEGRDEVFKVIGGFMSDVGEGVFQIVGPEGWGRSAIVAEWVKRTGSAHYFFQGGDGSDLYPHLIAQLIGQYGLLDSSERARELVAEWASTTRSTSMWSGRWGRERLQEILAEAVVGANGKIVIAIDGPGGTGASALPIQELPPNSFLIYSAPAALPTGQPSEVFRFDEASQRKAINRYLNRHAGPLREKLAEVIAKGEPSFLFAALLVAQSRTEDFYQIHPSAPETLEKLLEATLTALEREHWTAETAFRRLLEAPGPLELETPAGAGAKPGDDLLPMLTAATRLGLLFEQESSGARPARRFAFRHERVRAAVAERFAESVASGPGPAIRRRRALLVHATDTDAPEEYYPVKAEQEELAEALARAGFEVDTLIGERVNAGKLRIALKELRKTSSARDLVWLHLSGPGFVAGGEAYFSYSSPDGSLREPAGASIREVTRELLEGGVSALVLTVEGGDRVYLDKVAIDVGESRVPTLQLVSGARVKSAARSLVSHVTIEVLAGAAQSPPPGGLTIEEFGERVQALAAELGGSLESRSTGRADQILSELTGFPATESGEGKRAESALEGLVYTSHADEDQETASELGRELEALGLDVGVERERIGPDIDWEEELPKAIGRCDVAVVLLSRSSIEAEESWQRREWALVQERLEQEGDDSLVVLPVVVGDLRPDPSAVPRFLAERHWMLLGEAGVEGVVGQVRRQLEERRESRSEPEAPESATRGTKLAAPAFEVFAPPRGEAQLLHLGTQDDPRFVLIDGGGPGAYRRAVRPRLEKLRHELGLDGPVGLDLVVLTHMDDPQSHGILDLLEDLSRRRDDAQPPLVEIGGLWFNGRFDLDRAEEGSQLIRERKLRDLTARLEIPVNHTHGGDPVVSDVKRGPIAIDGARIWILSPSRDLLEKARKRPGGDPNRVAMALLVDIGGRRLLLPSDARGDDVLEGLDRHGLLEDGRIHVDLLKLPHQGSSRSTDPEFYQRVTADAYLVTGDGRHGLPDLETLDWLLGARGEAPVTLYFSPSPDAYHKSYPVDELRAFLEERSSRRPLEVVEVRPEEGSLLLDLAGAPA